MFRLDFRSTCMPRLECPIVGAKEHFDLDRASCSREEDRDSIYAAIKDPGSGVLGISFSFYFFNFFGGG